MLPLLLVLPVPMGLSKDPQGKVNVRTVQLASSRSLLQLLVPPVIRDLSPTIKPEPVLIVPKAGLEIKPGWVHVIFVRLILMPVALGTVSALPVPMDKPL